MDSVANSSTASSPWETTWRKVLRFRVGPLRTITPAIRAFAKQMPNGDYLEIAGAGHEVLMERNEYRAQFWAAFDAFLKAQRP